MVSTRQKTLRIEIPISSFYVQWQVEHYLPQFRIEVAIRVEEEPSLVASVVGRLTLTCDFKLTNTDHSRLYKLDDISCQPKLFR